MGGGEDGRSICEDQENRVSIKGGYKDLLLVLVQTSMYAALMTRAT